MEEKWIVRFANGQQIYIMANSDRQAMKRAGRALCQPEKEIIEVMTYKLACSEPAYKPEEELPY